MAQADDVVLETIDVQEEVEIETKSTPRRRRGRQLRVRVEKRHPASQRTRQQQTGKKPARAQRQTGKKPSRAQQRALGRKKKSTAEQPPAKKRRTNEPEDHVAVDTEHELDLEPSTSKKQGTRLLKKDIEAVCKSLLLIEPAEMLQTVRSSVEADATHLEAFPERENLWRHVRSSEALPDLVRQLSVGYVNVYKTHSKGKDKYAHFLVDWHELLSRFTVKGTGPEEEVWQATMDGAECSGSSEDRSAVVTSIAKAVYELLTENASQLHEERQSQGRRHTTSTYPQAKESMTDDDASVVRVSGFALHSAIRYRKKALQPKSRSRHNSITREKLKKELDFLKLLKAADKTFVPRVVSYQDRGRMTIMHSAMLDFGRALFSTVRATLNYESYTQHGADIFKHTHERVLKSTELLQKFKAGVKNINTSSTQPPTEESLLKTVYTTLITKMMHTINNDFLKNLSLLDKIAKGKGTDAKLLLRDKLKAAAADTQSLVQKI